MKRTLLLFFFLFAVWCLPAQVRFTNAPLSRLQRMAESEDKLIFIYLQAPWCGACRMLEREVFRSEAVGRFMEEHFVCARFDGEKEPGRTLARDEGVKAWPAMLVYDARGSLVARTVGARSEADFLRDMRSVLAHWEKVRDTETEP